MYASCHMCDGQRTTCGVNSLLPLLCGFLGHQIYVASALPIELSWEHILYVLKDLVASQILFLSIPIYNLDPFRIWDRKRFKYIRSWISS